MVCFSWCIVAFHQRDEVVRNGNGRVDSEPLLYVKILYRTYQLAVQTATASDSSEIIPLARSGLGSEVVEHGAYITSDANSRK